MDVSYRQIKAFVEVAKSSTFAEAAVNLHLTQPALSSAIKKMEEQLGGKLFQRNTRNVSLTPEGEVLFPNALRLLHDWDNTFSDIQNLFAMAKGQLTICAMPSFAESHLPNILSVFHRRIPNVNLRIVDVVMEQVIHEVTTGRSEIGFSFEPERKDGLVFKSLFADEFVVVTNKAQSAHLGDKLHWQDCLKLPLVMIIVGTIISFLVLSSILFSNLSINVFLSNPIGISSIISKVTVFVLCLSGYFKKLFFGQHLIFLANIFKFSPKKP